MNDLPGILNPASQVRWKTHEPVATAWVHPQYMMRRMEYALPDGMFCPLLGYNAHYLKWTLDKYLHPIPEGFVVG